MHTLRLLDALESPEVIQRRSYLYIVAFCALGLAVQLNAPEWQQSRHQPSIFFFALGLTALLTGVLALIVRRRARASLAANQTAENDKQTMASVARLRATRTAQQPAIDLHALLPSMENTVGTVDGAAKSTAAKSKVEKKHDPWSRLLEDVSQAAEQGQKAKRRPQPKRRQ